METQAPEAVAKSAFLLSPILVLMGLALIGGIIAVVLLLANPKTRPVGAVLLLVGLVGTLLLGFLVTFVHWGRSSAIEREREIAIEQDMRAQNAAQQAANYAAYEEMAIRQNARLAARGNEDSTVSNDDTPSDTSNDTPSDTSNDTAPETEKSSDEPAVDQRPAWVDAMPTTTNKGVLMKPITVGPYQRRIDCDRMLPAELQKAAQSCGVMYIGPKAHGRVSLPADYLAERVVVDRWEETVQTSFGPMVQLHVLLQFDEEVQQRIKKEVNEAYRQDTINERVWWAGGAMSAAVAVLAILFVGLKVARYGDGKQSPSKSDAEVESEGTST